MLKYFHFIRAKVEDFLTTDSDEQKELILENTSTIQETLVSSHGKKKLAFRVLFIF